MSEEKRSEDVTEDTVLSRDLDGAVTASSRWWGRTHPVGIPGAGRASFDLLVPERQIWR